MSDVARMPAKGTVDPSWLAVYVFYSAVPRPLLVECLRPLADEFRAEKLISGYFFINYWVQGPHVRFRVKAADPALTGEITARTEAAVSAFLAGRPALFEVKGEYLASLYARLFEREYSEEERLQLTDADGQMIFKPNNSLSWEPYEPEYGKYGGIAGAALSEWHFEESSDFVVDAMRDTNMHLRTVRLGFSAQLMLIMALAFLDEPAQAQAFLNGYQKFWYGSFADEGRTPDSDYGSHYDAIGPAVRRRLGAILADFEAGRSTALPSFGLRWRQHASELRGRVEQLAKDGGLLFDHWETGETWAPPAPADAVAALLLPYLHMTNNRLLVNIRDEAYLAYVLSRALRELSGVPVG